MIDDDEFFNRTGGMGDLRFIQLFCKMACTRSDAYEDQDGVVLEPEQELRDEFSCPITCDLIYDPVIAADGHTVSTSLLFKLHKKKKN